MPALVATPAPPHMSCFQGPLVIMKCKNNLQCTFFGRLQCYWAKTDKGWKFLLLEIISGWRVLNTEHTRNRKRLSFVSGLNQRLTEICPDRSKLFSMGNMWPPKWQCALREVKRYPLLLLRGTTWSTQKIWRIPSFVCITNGLVWGERAKW